MGQSSLTFFRFSFVESTYACKTSWKEHIFAIGYYWVQYLSRPLVFLPNPIRCWSLSAHKNEVLLHSRWWPYPCIIEGVKFEYNNYLNIFLIIARQCVFTWNPIFWLVFCHILLFYFILMGWIEVKQTQVKFNLQTEFVHRIIFKVYFTYLIAWLVTITKQFTRCLCSERYQEIDLWIF